MRLPPAARLDPGRCAVLALALLVPLLFTTLTNHVWEDYYITLRSSRHLVEGDGLVFQPGERLHTFTSPLGVLVPAFFMWVAHGNDAATLWLFRVFNIALLISTAALLWRHAVANRLGSVGRVLLFGLLCLDPKLTDFSTNGQETALLLFFTALLWVELGRAETPRTGWLAAAYAGLMWTRPDAFILAGAITVSHLLWRDPEPAGGRALWRPVGWGVLLGAAFYAPWLIWASSYYGSPIPHTIIAKGMQTPLPRLIDVALLPFRSVVGHSMLDYLFLPANFLFGGWPGVVRGFARILSLVAVFAWLVPGIPRAGRRASFAAFLGMFYLCTILVYAWYVPPWTFLAILAVAWSADALHDRFRRGQRTPAASAVRIAAFTAVAAQAAVLIAVTWQMRVQQRVIEDGGRHAIGDWLRRQAALGDTVFMEPLGYIGYFSGLKTYDFPGLSSREVVAAVRMGARRYADVVERLHPTWLVLRPRQHVRQGFPADGVIPGYHVVRTWDAQPNLDAVPLLPGRDWLEYDATFVVYRRNDAGSSPGGPAAKTERTTGSNFIFTSRGQHLRSRPHPA